MKRVICNSGITGWQEKLQKVYANYAEFVLFDSYYDIAKRLGYKSPRMAWQKNPIIQGSVNPSDLRKIA